MEPNQEPQDKALGAAASHDQAVVDALADEGIIDDELSDQPRPHRRAGGKAEPGSAFEIS